MYQTFLTNTDRARRAVICQINYDSNPWLSDRDRQEIESARLDDPGRFPHLYLGVPDDEGDKRKALTYKMVETCVEAWDRREEWGGRGYEATGRVHAGLDLADTGADRNALIARRGPLIFHVENWTGVRHLPKGSSIDPEEWDEIKSLWMQTVRRADGWCRTNGASRLYYDSGGGYGNISVEPSRNRSATGAGVYLPRYQVRRRSPRQDREVQPP